MTQESDAVNEAVLDLLNVTAHLKGWTWEDGRGDNLRRITSRLDDLIRDLVNERDRMDRETGDST